MCTPMDVILTIPPTRSYTHSLIMPPFSRILWRPRLATPTQELRKKYAVAIAKSADEAIAEKTNKRNANAEALANALERARIKREADALASQTAATNKRSKMYAKAMMGEFQDIDELGIAAILVTAAYFIISNKKPHTSSGLWFLLSLLRQSDMLIRNMLVTALILGDDPTRSGIHGIIARFPDAMVQDAYSCISSVLNYAGDVPVVAVAQCLLDEIKSWGVLRGFAPGSKHVGTVMPSGHHAESVAGMAEGMLIMYGFKILHTHDDHVGIRRAVLRLLDVMGTPDVFHAAFSVCLGVGKHSVASAVSELSVFSKEELPDAAFECVESAQALAIARGAQKITVMHIVREVQRMGVLRVGD